MFSIFKRRAQTDIKTAKNNSAKTVHFDDNIAKKILEAVRIEFGLDYSKQEYITMRKIERFAIKNEIYDFNSLHDVINSSPTMKEKLINMLTVGETYFYRELGHFEILNDLVDSKNIKNILCAPSSTGEEVYSILLYLQEKRREVNFRIIGIDVNSDAIEKAKDACYSRRSVSYIPKDILEKNFVLKNSNYCLNQSLRRYANFYRQNVFDKSINQLGKFDVIFCRNMLIYFNEKQKIELLQILKSLLNSEGILFLGHADISFVPIGFKKIIHGSSNYLQKT